MKKLSKRKVKERRKVGIVKAYMSRAAAVRALQIPLADFRRLCILKGVYPVEPRNKSKLTGDNTKRKTYFFKRDVESLKQEPILFKFWEFKVFMKRLTRAKGRHDLEKFQQVNGNKPIYKLDTTVKERYPRFIDALRDCDDALSMCFLFAMFPKGRSKPEDLIDMSRKLTIEFMHYVIYTKSLRKVFITIKGYYYQADIMGQTITWLVPHQFVIGRVSNVDLNVMKTFTEFYVTLLGFINYKLFKSINAVYPPQILIEKMQELTKTKSSVSTKQKKRKHSEVENDEAEMETDSRDELIAALNKRIKITVNKSIADAERIDQQPDVFENEDVEEGKEKAEKSENEKMTFQQVLALENLFSGLKFYLNREVPRESLTFVIRSFGGEVSWDNTLFPGATFAESDSTITHQIVDRTTQPERRLDRVYIQPQWVYDSINMKILLPTDDYLIGSTLPPHLSPFVNEKRGEYVPPDKVKMMNLRKQFEEEKKVEASIENELVGDKGINKSNSRSKMTVKQGKLKIENKDELEKKEDAETRRMNILMIPKKKKRLFDKIVKTQRQRNQKTEKMKAKRRIVDKVITHEKASARSRGK